LKVDSCVTVPSRGAMRTSVGGSLKDWRSATMRAGLPATATPEKLEPRVTGSMRPDGIVDAVDAVRAGVVDRPVERAGVRRPHERADRAVPVGGEFAPLAAAPVHQDRAALVAVEALDALLAVYEPAPVRAVARRTVVRGVRRQ
jgi:hypothetical protein